MFRLGNGGGGVVPERGEYHGEHERHGRGDHAHRVDRRNDRGAVVVALPVQTDADERGTDEHVLREFHHVGRCHSDVLGYDLAL